MSDNECTGLKTIVKLTSTCCRLTAYYAILRKTLEIKVVLKKTKEEKKLHTIKIRSLMLSMF